MKQMIKKQGLSAVILLALLAFPPSYAKSADWHSMGYMPDNAIHSYDKESLVRLTPVIVRIWVMKESTDTLVRRFLKNWSKEQGCEGFGRLFDENQKKCPDLPKPKKSVWAETRTLYEFDCNVKMIRLISYIDYDEEGNVLSSYSDSKKGWAYVVPESIGETYLRTVCAIPPEGWGFEPIKPNPYLDLPKESDNIEPAPEATRLRAIPF